MKSDPPKIFLHFFRWYCHPKLLDHIEGDLIEVYQQRLNKVGKRRADIKFIIDVLLLFRPSIIKPMEGHKNLNNYGMIKNYFTIALRNIKHNNVFSTINILGLAVGMASVILIGTWINDELSFNNYHRNYNSIAQVMRHSVVNGDINTRGSLSIPLGEELKSKYLDEFKYIVMALPNAEHVLNFEDNRYQINGCFMEPDAPEMLSLEMTKGSLKGLINPSSILLSESASKILFNDVDPINKTLQIDDKMTVAVTGVYRDLPYNSRFKDLMFIAPWALHLSHDDWAKKAQNNWGINSFEIFVQLIPGAEIASTSARIKDAIRNNIDPKLAETRRPEVFLHPMDQWHLYSEWEHGVNTRSRIQFIWLFGIIGLFILILACINFMNLSTARSERHAKEVGIRKVVGSAKSQLVAQFFTESVSLAMFGFILSLIFVNLTLPFFNVLADKKMNLLWTTPAFWILGFGFTLLTGLIAGSYPAFFLSSFKPIEVLKGTFRLRTFSVLPRKMLVVLQFTVSVTLIIGTAIVYKQILFAKNRPVGYSRERLLVVKLTSPEIQNHYEALKNELLGIEAITSVAASQNPTTEVWDNRNGFEWSNLNSNIEANFATMATTHNYGKTVGWQFVKGRDFSNEYATDASSIVLNESASKSMGFENPVGEIVKWGGEDLKVIGVIKDMIMTSPYEPVEPTVFYLNSKDANFINIKIKDDAVLDAALVKAEKTFKKYNAPFDYKFADQEYNLKFSNETRLGQLAIFFTMLAIFISCMGIFGVSSFIAEQRTKEIGIRKVLGASVFNVWGMLSTEFVFLVLLSCLIAIPVSYYFLSDWLKTFQYHTEMSWWVFALSGTGALVITLATVSFQAVKAAMGNPVDSLKSE